MSSPLYPEQVEIIAAVQRHLRDLGKEIEEIEKRHSNGDSHYHWFFHTVLTYDTEIVGEFTDELGDNTFCYFPGTSIVEKIVAKSIYVTPARGAK